MSENGDYGTFKDARRAPIHRWFMYPAGYSPKLVYQKIKQFNLNKNSSLFDPFLGSGTTCLAAKEKGIYCIGIEAHTFVGEIAKVKLMWDYDFTSLENDFKKIVLHGLYSSETIKAAEKDHDEIPELLTKCYSKKNLINLLRIKHAIQLSIQKEDNRRFLNLVLTATLRLASSAGTGWPYIAPTKFQGKKIERDAIDVFKKQFRTMLSDVQKVKETTNFNSEYRVIIGDSRQKHDIKNGSIDLAITSPPYLNNFDYADRTRLETYFFGLAKNWADITEQIRDKLMVSATTQTKRTGFDPYNCVSKELGFCAPHLAKQITDKVIQLSTKRTEKGGKKSYDIMVAKYFNDMFPIMKNTFEYLKDNGVFVLVLGDSAPYGIHIATETYIGEMGKAIGFSSYDIEELRKRGEKWAKNPQRHTVPLRESILTLRK